MTAETRSASDQLEAAADKWRLENVSFTPDGPDYEEAFKAGAQYERTEGGSAKENHLLRKAWIESVEGFERIKEEYGLPESLRLQTLDEILKGGGR